MVRQTRWGLDELTLKWHLSLPQSWGVASQSSPSNVISDLEVLADALEGLELAAPIGPDHWADRRDRVVKTIRSYLIPRIRDPLRPLVVVFAGPTGAGKSTLLNSVAGAELSRTGPLRPTTKSPVVFAAVGRSQSYHVIGGVACKVVTGKAKILGELTLVDTPDIDSTEAGHRRQAETLIDNADVVIFVTSAMRYADLVPWEVLRRAESRGAPVIPVLNRIRRTSEGARHDYQHQLDAEGLDSELMAVHEYNMDSGRQMVPAAAIRRLRGRLVDLVEHRRSEASNTVASVMKATIDQARDVVSHAQSRIEETGSWNVRLDTLFSPDVDRLAMRVEQHHLGDLDPKAIAALEGSRRFRIRRFLAKNGQTPHEMTEASRRIVHLVAGSVEADLRRAVIEADVRRALDSPLPVEIHPEIMLAVLNWKASLEEGLVTLKHPYRDTALLLELAFTVDDRAELAEAFETVAPDLSSYALRTGSRWSLEADLAPIYESVKERVRRAVVSPASTTDDIQLVRDALSVLRVRELSARV